MKFLIMILAVSLFNMKVYATESSRLVCSDDRVEVEIVDLSESEINLFWNGYLIDLTESDENIFYFSASGEEVSITFNSANNSAKLVIDDNDPVDLNCGPKWTGNSELVLQMTGRDFPIEWLATEVDESDIEDTYEFADGPDQAFIDGTMCFNGQAEDIISIFNYFDNYVNLFDGEMKLKDITKISDDQLSFQIFGGPNDTVFKTNTVERCK